MRRQDDVRAKAAGCYGEAALLPQQTRQLGTGPLGSADDGSRPDEVGEMVPVVLLRCHDDPSAEGG